MERKTNWIAFIAAIVAGFAIGFTWYGVVFNKIWMAGNGITQEGDRYLKNGVEMSQSPTPMIFNLVAMGIYAYLMDWLVKKTGVSTWMEGAKLGAVVGFIMLLGIFSGNFFSQNPISLSVVDGSYPLVMFTIFGAIIGGWQKK